MRDPVQIREVAAKAEEALGQVDVLVNNAAVVWPLGPTTKVDPLDWEAAFQINLFGSCG